MAELRDEPLAQQTQQHRSSRVSPHLVRRGVVRQVVSYDELLLPTIDCDDEVAFGIVLQWISRPARADWQKLFHELEHVRRGITGDEAARIACRQGIDALFEG